MSLKNIEMQVALPRTHDAGKVQHEMNQQSNIVQSHLAEEANRKEALKRKKVNELNKKEKAHFQKENESRNQKQKGKKPAKHPYKGNRFDCTM